jgi:hypothetical protein
MPLLSSLTPILLHCDHNEQVQNMECQSPSGSYFGGPYGEVHAILQTRHHVIQSSDLRPHNALINVLRSEQTTPTQIPSNKLWHGV